MTASSSRKPAILEAYEYGRSPRHNSTSSSISHVRFDGSPSAGTSSHLNIPEEHGDSNGDNTTANDLRHRRSSLSMRINSLAQIGGVNSLESFARSWQRAAGFYEIVPNRSSFVISEQERSNSFQHNDVERAQPQQKSLLRQQLEEQGTPPEEVLVEQSSQIDESTQLTPEDNSLPPESLHGRGNDIFVHAPHLSSPFASEYGGIYGSLSSNINDSSKRHAAHLYREQQAAGVQQPDKEREPLLVKRVEREDGKFVNVVVGQSTLPQTILNSVNVLIGVGLLSLPLGMRYAGWLLGLISFILSAIVTRYTAGLLAKCLDVDDTLITFADLGYIAFGSKARLVISILFTLELTAACVALVVLFGDSLDALIPGWGVVEWKVLCGLFMVLLCFVPLRLLSYSSLLGIGCCFGIVALLIIDGLLKPHAPGSLREPASTFLLPQDWFFLPLSFGLLMSPWGGHSVFPNIYRDMRHPKKYSKGLGITYGFTFLLDLTMAVVGMLMFGSTLRDEVTSNIFMTPGYPRAISIVIAILIAVIPLTKLPLNARPIISTVEIACGLDNRAVSGSPGLVGMSAVTRGLFKFGIRLAIVIAITVIAIFVPSFDRVMALMGSAFCFTICVILPIAFYLKLFGRRISLRERVLDWILIIICSILAVIGTIWAFLPKHAEVSSCPSLFG